MGLFLKNTAKKSLFIRVKSSLLKGNGFRGYFVVFIHFVFLFVTRRCGRPSRQKTKGKGNIILIKNYTERVVDRGKDPCKYGGGIKITNYGNGNQLRKYVEWEINKWNTNNNSNAVGRARPWGGCDVITQPLSIRPHDDRVPTK